MSIDRDLPEPVETGTTAMSCSKFEVRQTGRGRDWVVLVGSKLYGRYLSREEAILDALDAAEDARCCGQAAEVIGADVLALNQS